MRQQDKRAKAKKTRSRKLCHGRGGVCVLICCLPSPFVTVDHVSQSRRSTAPIPNRDTSLIRALSTFLPCISLMLNTSNSWTFGGITYGVSRSFYDLAFFIGLEGISLELPKSELLGKLEVRPSLVLFA